MNLSSLTWNWNYFGSVGYLGVGMTVVVLLLWFFHFVLKAKPFISQIALVFAVLAFGLAKVNSVSHVNRIQIDPAAQQAAFEALQEAKRKALLESRGEEVAQIRFAEDGDDEFLDRAGMDESDLKYFDKQIKGDGDGEGEENSGVPEWKRDKKTRSSTDSEGGGEGVVLEGPDEKEPILMAETELATANQLDAWNLKLAKWMVFFGAGIVLLDHLRRANIYGEAYLPLPLSSSLLNMVTPHPSVVIWPQSPRRDLPGELEWLLKRGDSFIYLTDNSASADEVAKKLQYFEKRRLGRTEVLKAESSSEEGAFSDEFAFESWWHGRASFAVGSEKRARQLTEQILVWLEKRKDIRARVRQTAHLVWDLSEPMPTEWQTTFEQLAKRTGVSLFLCRSGVSMGERKVPEPAERKVTQSV